MNRSFKKRQTLFIVQLTIGTAILFLLHSYLINMLVPNKEVIIPLWNIYTFHAISVLIVYSILNFRFSKGKIQVFNYFIILMVLKMIFVVIFLLPVLLSDGVDKVGDVVNFFIPYFFFLAFEVYSINQFLVNK